MECVSLLMRGITSNFRCCVVDVPNLALLRSSSRDIGTLVKLPRRPDVTASEARSGLQQTRKACSNTCGCESPQGNLSAVLYKVNDLRLEQRPIPEPGEKEVLLKIACVGICGSDVHYYQHGAIGQYVVKKPMVIGHEIAGIVEKLGPCVTNLKVGDRVAVEPNVPCRKCQFCKEGRYNLCADIFFCATPPDDGAMCQYYKHAADFCYKLPDHVSLEEGALLEPISIGVVSCRRGCVTLGSVVLIEGAGPIGLVTLMVAKAMGASKVLVTDIVDHSLETAEKFGADCTLKVGNNDDDNEVAKKVKCLLGEEPDVTIDCNGSESTIRLGMKVTRSGGILVVAGMTAEKANIPITNVSFREVDVRGTFRHINSYPQALSLVASGNVNAEALITHHYPLEEAVEAFKHKISGKGNPIKIMIHCIKK